MYPVELTGERVILRELSAALASRLWPVARAEPGVFGPPGFADTEPELRAWLKRQEDQATGPGRVHYRWAVERRDTGDLIGSTRCYIENIYERQGSIGYAMAAAHRRRGFALEAVTLAIAFGFEALDLHRIWATIEPDNEASLAMIGKLGFRREGFLEKRIRVGDDDWRDAYLYATTADEWRTRSR